MLKRTTDFIFENSLPLIVGSVVALLWANIDFHSYHNLVSLPLLKNAYFGFPQNGYRIFDLHYFVNDVLMALFFAMAGREVWISMLPGGELHQIRRASLPVICAVGGMAGPAFIYFSGALLLGRFEEIGHGWAIPTATDIAFSYLVARLIFGRLHPAVNFLLLLAIVDDALGLLVLAAFYPQEPVNAWWLLLSLGAVGMGVGFWMLRIRSFLWYLLIPGTISWVGFALSGLHPALGLLPIVPVLPQVHLKKIHQGWDFVDHSDMHAFEYWLRKPVEVILGLFGLLNAGVLLRSPDVQYLPVTLLVLMALVAGKPLGIMLTAWFSVKVLKLHMKISWVELLVMSLIAGIGFTVALFVATVAFRPGPLTDAAKLGAIASVAAALVAWIIARSAGITRLRDTLTTEVMPSELPDNLPLKETSPTAPKPFVSGDDKEDILQGGVHA